MLLWWEEEGGWGGQGTQPRERKINVRTLACATVAVMLLVRSTAAGGGGAPVMAPLLLADRSRLRVPRPEGAGAAGAGCCSGTSSSSSRSVASSMARSTGKAFQMSTVRVLTSFFMVPSWGGRKGPLPWTARRRFLGVS